MRNKKGFEMTISVVVVLVISLILLSVGIYIIYTKILKPSETANSFLNCEDRGGEPGCTGKTGGLCVKLPTRTSKDPVDCYIKELK